MNDIYSCGSCTTQIERSDVISHLTTQHLELKLRSNRYYICCGECRSTVREDELLFMLEHCSRSGHSTEKVRIDWDEFAQVEADRIQNILASGLKIISAESNNPTSRKAPKGEDETSSSKSKANQHQNSSHDYITKPSSSQKYSDESGRIFDPPRIQKRSEASQEKSFYQDASNEKILDDRNSEIDHLSPIKSGEQFSTNSEHLVSTPYSISDSGSFSDSIDQIKTSPEIHSRPPYGSNDFAIKLEAQQEENENSQGKPSSVIKQEPQEEKRIVVRSKTMKRSAVMYGTISKTGKQYSFEGKKPKTDLDETQKKQLFQEACQLCPFKVDSQFFCNIKLALLRHASTHSNSVFFQCVGCDFKARRTQDFHRHKLNMQRNEDCNGKYINIQTEESMREFRQILAIGFPKIDWSVVLPPGEVYLGLKF